MEKLNLNSFLSIGDDLEKKQYQILGALKKYSESFSNFKLYPHLSNLVDIFKVLHTFSKNKRIFEKKLPRDITGVDLKNLALAYKILEIKDENLSDVFSLIQWATPIIRQVIEEGGYVYDCAEQNISIETVGLHPLHTESGYALFSLPFKKEIHVYLYAILTSRSGEGETYILKTSRKEILHTSLRHSNLKSDIMQKYAPGRNPAMYEILYDIDFPFEETLFPVGKRKLLEYLRAA